MTTEQREAIEIISKYLNFNEIYGTRNFKEAIETVLSMLKEKDKEIENLKMEKDEAWEEWNNLEQGTYEEEQRLKSAIKKKNKIIDLMAEYIANRDNDEDICRHQVAEWCEDEEDGVLVEVCRKCIKQYFERKIEK